MTSITTYRVNFYFTNGKSLGFIKVDLDSKYEQCDKRSQNIRNAIDAFNLRDKDTMILEDNNASYMINIYEIAYIEVLRRTKGV